MEKDTEEKQVLTLKDFVQALPNRGTLHLGEGDESQLLMWELREFRNKLIHEYHFSWKSISRLVSTGFDIEAVYPHLSDDEQRALAHAPDIIEEFKNAQENIQLIKDVGRSPLLSAYEKRREEYKAELAYDQELSVLQVQDDEARACAVERLRAARLKREAAEEGAKRG